MTDTPAVTATDLVKHYEGGLVKALRGVSFRIEAGESVAIVGPSGSGKTTLLHLVGALDLATSGRIELFGRDLAKEPDLDRLRSEVIGFVFQLHHLVPNLPLWENVALPTYPRGLPRGERRKRAADLLDKVGLGHRVDFLPVKCSGGERQRAAVARALVNDPQLLLADEPTGSVDTATGEKILELFDTLGRDRSMTRVVITHNEALAARSDRTLRIVDGLMSEASPAPAPQAPDG